MSMLTPAQKDDAKQFFVAKMAALYSPPYHIRSNEEKIVLSLTEYVDALGHYGPVVLDDAWNTLRRTHDKQGWPVLAVCLKACAEAQRTKSYVAKKPPAEEPTGPPSRILSPEQYAEHMRLMADVKHKDGPLGAMLRRVGQGILDAHHAAGGNDRTGT